MATLPAKKFSASLALVAIFCKVEIIDITKVLKLTEGGVRVHSAIHRMMPAESLARPYELRLCRWMGAKEVARKWPPWESVGMVPTGGD